MNFQYDIFISYSRKDLEVVKGIKEEIERATKAHCWMDLLGIESGAPHFIQSIIDGINMCKVFLFMRSEQSQVSKYALRELHYAEEEGKKFVIVHIDKSPMSKDFKFLYNLANTIDWDNQSQREKLLRDISKWIGSTGLLIKEKNTTTTFTQNVFKDPQYDSELEVWNRDGDDFFYGRNGNTKNYAEAVKWYHKAAEQGLAEAQFNLGYCYDLGIGLTQDEAISLKWYRKAAEQKFAIAQYKLGIRYSLGLTRRKTECVKWLHTAAEQGLIVAQYFLGICYQHGEGVIQNHTESVKWYRTAAEQGYTSAQYQLGVCYSKGMGITEDRTEAVKWYKMAAVQKDVLAHIKLGNFYISGFDITKDETEAIEWYHKYAETHGDVAAQYSLGNSYEYGYGVTKNIDEAMKWYHMAAEQGHGDAKKAFERLKMGFPHNSSY